MADLTGILPVAMTAEQEAAASAAVARAYDAWLDDQPDAPASVVPGSATEYPSFTVLVDAGSLDDFSQRVASELAHLGAPGLALAEAAVKHTGAMVALYPAAKVAKALAVEGGEPVKDIHLTLAFLGKAAELPDHAVLADIVRGWAATTPVLTGVVSGVGKFTAGPDPVTYASPDLPALPAARETLVAALAAGGYEPSTRNGFSPHMTLIYDDVDVSVPNRKLVFDKVSLVLAGRRLDFPLLGAT